MQRTRILYGDNAVQKLQDSTVAVFGLGGVGGYVAEGLVRSGVGHLIFIDKDVIEPTNLNRQILATTDTLGAPKVEAAAQRAQSIHPGINITPYCLTYTDQLPPEIACADYVADCIDDVKAKVNLILACQSRSIPIISSMGTALRTHPELLEVTDLFKTSYDPLARVMRKALREAGVKNLTVVCSKEVPKPRTEAPLGSSVFVPAAAGLLMASEIVRDLTKNITSP